MQKEFRWEHLSRYRQELYGISILWIILFHFEGVYPSWAGWLLDYGNMGVELFLFASGFSLYFTMQKKPALSEYYARRLLRTLLPVFVICSWRWLYLFFRKRLTVTKMISLWTCLNFWITGQQQVWFVSFLLVAYFVFPYIYSFQYEEARSPWLRCLLQILASMVFAGVMMKRAPAYYDMTEIALTRFPIFILGCAFGRTIKEKKVVRNGGWLLLGLGFVLVLSFAVLNLVPLGQMTGRYFYLIPGFALSVLLPELVARIRTRWEKSGRFLRYMGMRSLELYLLHILFGRILLPLTGFYDRRNVVHYFIMLAGCLLLAWPAHWIVEKLRSLIEKIPLFRA